MSLQKITFTNGTVSAQKDADFYYFLLNDIGVLRGIKHGLQVTNNVNRIVFKSGYVNIYGRMLFVEEDTTVTIPLNQVAYGYVIIRVNTSNNTAELTYKEGTANYPDLTQENIMQEFGIYEFALAKYSKTSTNLALQEFTPKYIDKKESSYLGTENKDKVLIVGNDGYIALQSKDDILVGKAKTDEKGTNISNKFSNIDNSINSLNTDLTSLNTDLTSLNTDLTSLNTDLTSHKNNTSNPHNVTKSQVGLGNVDNTSDLAKPISTATQNALNTKVTAESNKGLMTQQILANTDLNTVKTNGFYGVSQNCTNKPANKDDGNLIVLQYDSSNIWTTQVYITLNLSENKNRIYSRGYNNSTNSWSSWKQIDNDPSLYNLGAYDTYVDNGDGTTTITRQTGYVNIDDLLDGIWDVKYDKYLEIFKDLNCNDSYGITSNLFKTAPDLNWDGTNSGIYYDTNEDKIVLKAINLATLTNTQWKEKLQKLGFQIQYKLATSYTEKIITGVPQITLDKQGCEWLRSEWEKGLNLLNIDNISNNSIIYSNLPAGTYTFSLKTTGDGDGFNLKINSLSGDTIGSAGIKNGYGVLTFTTTKVIDLFFNGWGNANTNYDCMLVRSSIPYPYQPYKGELIRQSTLENQTPMLGVQGNKKVMLGCRGQEHITSGHSKYIYLAKWDNLGQNENDSGIHIKGIIGGWLYATQAIIDVVASFRNGYNFKGFMNEKQPIMNIVITDAGKVYLECYDTQYINYTIDIECGNNGTITYTGDLLDTIDGSIVTSLNDKVNTPFPYFPLNGGLIAITGASDWGVTTGSEVLSLADTSGGGIKFKKDCPSAGKMSLLIDGDVYTNEGVDKLLVSSATSITNAQGEWFSSEDGHIDFGTSANVTRIYSNSQPEWWKNGIKQGEIALKSDIVPYEPNDVADYGATSVKVDAGALYVFSVYIEDDRKFYTGSIYVPNNYSNPCCSAIIATFGNYKYLVICAQRSSISAQGTLKIEKQLLDGSAGTNTNSYFNKVFKMF